VGLRRVDREAAMKPVALNATVPFDEFTEAV
jgi:hypothetical protein